jgi:acetyl-CoA acyltransferase
VPAETVNRYCSSGVQSIAHAAYAILSGDIDVAIAGGAESMSMVPMFGYKFSPNPHFAQDLPHYYTNMGLTAENLVVKYGISREDQDAFALRSNQRAASAVDSGLFDPELVPVEVELHELDAQERPTKRAFTLERDEGPRGDSTMEGLAKLRPAFKEGGTVTAGNASQMSDGAAAVIIMSAEKARQLGLKPLARFVSFAVAGVEPDYVCGDRWWRSPLLNKAGSSRMMSSLSSSTRPSPRNRWRSSTSSSWIPSCSMSMAGRSPSAIPWGAPVRS